MCTDMHKDVCTDVCIDMRIYMRIYMCIDMCTAMTSLGWPVLSVCTKCISSGYLRRSTLRRSTAQPQQPEAYNLTLKFV